MNRFHPILKSLAGALYPVWAAFWVLLSARSFYGSMMRQTGGEWSAPLDDVFIHFDYARAVSEGYPLEWLSGQGISTGNTSLTYPMVLALGIACGFDGSRLLVFAAWLACMCVFGVTLLAPRLMRACFPEPFANTVSWFFPPALVSVGVLCWSLWSGMEVAFFLALWASALAAFLARQRGILIALCIFLVATRPEAIGVVLSFALFWRTDKVQGASRMQQLARGLRARSWVALPALGFLIGQACFNRLTTGEWTQNGALVKLALYNPYYDAEAKIDDYWFNLKFAYFWNIETHITDVAVYGYALVALALFAVIARETRTLAFLLLSTMLSWTVIVALNGQIRWQNQRYTTPAIAWLLCMATLGFAAMLRASRVRTWSLSHWAVSFWVGLLLTHGIAAALRPTPEPPSVRISLLASILIAGLFAIVIAQPWVRRGLAVTLAAVFALHQAPKRQEQAWFFGRACRNIRDQQVSLGRWLGELDPARDNASSQKTPTMPRVLVGDAGAILYESRWGGLDMIGLGGLYGLPFARAYQQGLGASVELIERLPIQERPQLLAIFPSWWEHLPLWFGGAMLRTFPAEGNVICGDYAHVVYQADWHLLGTGEKLTALPGRTREVRDAIDIGDLVSEREHRYRASDNGHIGVSIMRILPGNAGGSDMWDGGREIEPGHSESFELSSTVIGAEAELVIRTAPQGESHVRIFINDALISKTSFTQAKDGEAHFVERPVHLPATAASRIRVRIENDGPQTFTNFHVYLAQ